MRKLIMLAVMAVLVGLAASYPAHDYVATEKGFDSALYGEITSGGPGEFVSGSRKQARRDDGRKQAIVRRSDARTRVRDTSRYPESAVVEVGDSCTGTVISTFHVLTSGHCLFDPRTGKWKKRSFTVTPGRSGRRKPFGSFHAFDAIVPRGWSRGFNDAYDLGILVFSEPIGNYTGHFGTWGNRAGGRDGVNIISYPGDRAGRKQWRQYCPARTARHFLLHQCDTADGSSGAPLYVYDRRTGERHIIGVHEGGYSGRENRAVRLNGPRWDFVKRHLEWLR